MSKKKGVSAEEKRTRMMQLFYEKKDFFQLKELEKIAPKEKGIIVQSVKDVVQSLVDDGLVDTDKIGTSIYFWAYPSKAKHLRKRKLDELKEKLEIANKRLKTTKEELDSHKQDEVKLEETSEVMAEVAELRLKKENLEAEVQKYQDSDPEVFEELKKKTEALKDATNRWTDNIFALKTWCKSKFSVDEATLNKQLGISADLDYLN